MQSSKSLMAVLALSPMLSWASLCDDTYYLQGATQTLFSGADPKNLAKATAVLETDLSDMAFIHDQMAYSILAGFEGSCTKAAKPVRFLQREGQSAALTSRIETGYQVVMYDSNTVLEGSSFGYWFAFYKPADSLKLALGRPKDGSVEFRGWYGFVTFEDSVRNPESGLWTSKGTRLRMAGPADSASLDSALMIRTGYRDMVFDENRRGHFKLQFIRVSLENRPTAVGRRPVWADGAAPVTGPALYRLDGKRIDAAKPGSAFGNRRYPAGRR